MMYTIPLVPEVCMGEKSTPYNRLSIFSIEKKNLLVADRNYQIMLKLKQAKYT